MSYPFTPTWLRAEDIAAWLHLDPVAPADLDLLNRVAAAVEPVVQHARPDGAGEDGSYTPAADTYAGAVMMGARVFRRRNTASGIETFADSITYVANRDPDIQQFLQTGPYAPPRVG